MAAVTHDISDVDKSALLVNKFKTNHPTAGQNLTDGIIVSGSVGVMGYLNVMFSSSIAGVLTVTKTVGATTDVQKLNLANALGVNAKLAETIEVVSGETVNFTFSTDGGTYTLRVGSVIQR
jgi:hypothetical protein